jgi:isopenicillin N synthase-like dioxygenase
VRQADGSWVCVPAHAGELTVFLGSLIAPLSGFALHGVTHRVANPKPSRAADSRRLSIGFSLKPDYTARAVPPPAVRAVLPHAPPASLAEEAPLIGQVGRVGWQSYQMQTAGLSRTEAVARFKPWKNRALAQLRRAALGDE